MQSSLKHHFLTSLKRGLLNVLKFLSTFKVMVVIEGTVAFFALYLFLSLSIKHNLLFMTSSEYLYGRTCF